MQLIAEILNVIMIVTRKVFLMWTGHFMADTCDPSHKIRTGTDTDPPHQIWASPANTVNYLLKGQLTTVIRPQIDSRVPVTLSEHCNSVMTPL